MLLTSAMSAPALRNVSTAVVWTVALLVTQAPAHAKRLALVVGNAAYQGESVLRNPVNDATDMAQALRSLGVQVFENQAHTNQSRQDMNALIGRFLHAAEGAAVFYAATASKAPVPATCCPPTPR